MKKRLVAVGVGLLLVSIGLSGCNEIMNVINPEKNKFIGTWDGDDYDYVFLSDDTFSAGQINGTWKVEKRLLVLTISGGSQLAYTYIFSNNDRTVTLTIAGGTSSAVFTKQ